MDATDPEMVLEAMERIEQVTETSSDEHLLADLLELALMMARCHTGKIGWMDQPESESTPVPGMGVFEFDDGVRANAASWQGPWADAIRSARPVICPQPHLSLLGERLQASVATPIQHRGLTVGAIFLTGANAIESAGLMSIFGRLIAPTLAAWRSHIRLQRQRDARRAFERVAQQTRVAAWEWNVRRDRVWFSPQFHDRLGYADGELPQHGRAFSDLVHPDDREGVAKMLTHRTAGGESPQGEFRLRTQSQGYRWFRGDINVVWDSMGRPQRVAGTIVDVTRARETQALLQALDARFQVFFNASPMGLVLWGLGGRIVEVNPAFATLIGRPAALLRGHTFADLIIPDQTPHTGWIAELEASGQAGPVERHLVRPNGDPVPITEHAFRTQTAEGASQYWSMVTDITDRVRAADKVRRANERFEVAVGGTEQGIWEVDLRYGQAYASPQLLAIFGYAPGEVELKADIWKGIVNHEDCETLWSLAKRCAEGEIPRFKIEIRAQRRDAAQVWCEIRGVAQRDEFGQVIRLSGSLVDITENKTSEAAVIEAREAALAASRAKSQFLATMSHEIRTPMNGVLGMTSLLLDTELTADQRSFADTIRGSAEALLSIINDVLDFSKVEAGHLELEQMDFEPAEVLEDVVQLVAGQAEAKGIELACRLDINVPALVVGDVGRVRQVLVNLLGNAVKFTETGAVTARLCLDDDGQLAFSVHDTGIGITEGELSRLFEPFTQADASTTRRYGGTGLGLSICQRLAEFMGGQITVASIQGEGSIFVFRAALPQRRGPAATVRFEGRRALLLGHLPVSQAALSEALRQRGIEVVCGWPEGVPVDASRFDLLFVDEDSRIVDVPKGLTVVALHGRAHQGSEGPSLRKPVRRQQLDQLLGQLLGGVAKPSLTKAVTQVPLAGRVLLVEDNVVNQRVARLLLERMGIRVDIAANGREAIEAFAHHPFDLVLMDCQMPVMDGFEATRRIRRMGQRGRHIPILALTANALAADRARCLEAGMNEHVSKPIRPVHLRAALDRWLGQPTPPPGLAIDRGPADSVEALL